MVKGKEWLKEEMSSMYPSYNEIYVNPDIDEVLELIDQLDEPEKVVVPQFVANYLKTLKDNNYDLMLCIYDGTHNYKIGDWLFDAGDEQSIKNRNLIMRAWLDGYEVEKEKKYYVDLDTAAYVAKWNGDNQVGIYTDGISGSDEFEFHLTEQEIKDYDERFWHFAIPIEEVTE